MKKKQQEPAANATRDTDQYMPGDPIPVPHAVEADSESVWAHFTDTAQPDEPDFADTVPASAMEISAIDNPLKNTRS
jgi:hypothetical protein